MNWYGLFYLFSIVDKLTNGIIALAVICSIFYALFTILYFYHRTTANEYKGNKDSNRRTNAENWLKNIKWPRRIVLTLMVIGYLLVIFVPSRKDMIIIIAGGAVGEFVMNDKNAKQLPADITRFLRGEILKATADLTDEAKASIGIKSKADSLKELSKEQLIKMLTDKK